LTSDIHHLSKKPNQLISLSIKHDSLDKNRKPGVVNSYLLFCGWAGEDKGP